MNDELFIDFELINGKARRYTLGLVYFLSVVIFSFQYYTQRNNASWSLYPLLIVVSIINFLFNFFSKSPSNNYLRASKNCLILKKSYWLWKKKIDWNAVKNIYKYQNYYLRIELHNQKVYEFDALNIKEEELTELIQLYEASKNDS